jgi:acetyltransferase
LHEGHSEHAIRMRFFSLVKHLARDVLIRLCNLDYDREMALVAVHRDGGRPHIIGVSRYYLDPETGVAEFAVIVGESWQGRGLGWHLMERLIAIARQQSVRRLIGVVLRENQAMIKMAQELGFQVETSPDPTVVEVVLDLQK